MDASCLRLVPLAGSPMPARGMLVWNPALVAPSLDRFLESAARTLAALPPVSLVALPPTLPPMPPDCRQAR
ncbi:hypothetical protein CBM2608_U30017 [Cupriavidus taiwanensis]|nr:hypothetical protein CBM2608_U30017 [Cupriavidus taiwanensis]